MAFKEITKLEVKRRAHFSCVICHQPFVEIHHIMPEAEGGSDDLANAAPLCASCHDLFGGNPDKRKQIREMRDLWYELCETRFRNSPALKLAEAIEEIKSRQTEQDAMLGETKNLLEHFYSQQSDQIALASTASEVAALTGVSIPQGIRWLTAPWNYEELRDKSVFAHFVPNSGNEYEGRGEIRVSTNREGLLAIDLVFTRRDTPYQFTDTIFHISPRQLPHLVKAENKTDFDFEYQGLLTSDNQPDAS